MLWLLFLSCRTFSWGQSLFYIFHTVYCIYIINLFSSSEMSTLCFNIRLIRQSINLISLQIHSILDLLSWSTTATQCSPTILLLEISPSLLWDLLSWPQIFFLFGSFLHFSGTCPLVIYWEMVHRNVKLFRNACSQMFFLRLSLLINI